MISIIVGIAANACGFILRENAAKQSLQRCSVWGGLAVHELETRVSASQNAVAAALTITHLPLSHLPISIHHAAPVQRVRRPFTRGHRLTPAI